MKWWRSLKPTDGWGTKEEVLLEQKKIMKSTASCGEWNRDYAACLKNSVQFLVAYKYIKQTSSGILTHAFNLAT